MSEFSIHVTEQDCPLVTIYKDWLEAQGLQEPDEYDEEADYVSKILTMDYCHWMLRKTSGNVVDGAHASDAWAIRRIFINEYQIKFSKPYFDVNDGKTS